MSASLWAAALTALPLGRVGASGFVAFVFVGLIAVWISLVAPAIRLMRGGESESENQHEQS